MTHQDCIINIISTLLQLPLEQREALFRGNPFDKLINSYHYHTKDGEYLYRKKLAHQHWRMSVDAYNVFKDGGRYHGKKSLLYGEHRIPVSIIRDRLKACDGSIERVRKILDANEVVIITKWEQKRLDSAKSKGGLGLKKDLPEGGGDRLDFAGILIASETDGRKL